MKSLILSTLLGLSMMTFTGCTNAANASLSKCDCKTCDNTKKCSANKCNEGKKCATGKCGK
jgi:hypothetical protein